MDYVLNKLGSYFVFIYCISTQNKKIWEQNQLVRFKQTWKQYFSKSVKDATTVGWYYRDLLGVDSSTAEDEICSQWLICCHVIKFLFTDLDPDLCKIHCHVKCLTRFTSSVFLLNDMNMGKKVSLRCTECVWLTFVISCVTQ